MIDNCYATLPLAFSTKVVSNRPGVIAEIVPGLTGANCKVQPKGSVFACQTPFLPVPSDFGGKSIISDVSLCPQVQNKDDLPYGSYTADAGIEYDGSQFTYYRDGSC